MERNILEAYILYGCIINNYVPDEFDPADFYYFEKVAKAVSDLKKKNQPADMVSVKKRG